MAAPLPGFSIGATTLITGLIGAAESYNSYLNDTSSATPSSTSIQADLTEINNGLAGAVQGALMMGGTATEAFADSLTPLGIAATVANLSQLAQLLPGQMEELGAASTPEVTLLLANL